MVIFPADGDQHLTRRDIEKLASLIHGFHGSAAISVVTARLGREMNYRRRTVWQRVIDRLTESKACVSLYLVEPFDAEVD